MALFDLFGGGLLGAGTYADYGGGSDAGPNFPANNVATSRGSYGGGGGLFSGGLLGGGGLDIYGDLFTDEQKKALKAQQLTSTLAKLSQGFAKAAMPSRMPIPLGAALGEAAGAAAGGQDEASERMLKAMEMAEKVRTSQQQRALAKRVEPIAWQLVGGETVAAPANQPPAPDAVPIGPLPAAVPPGSNTSPLPPIADTGAPPGGLMPGAFGVPSQNLSRYGLPLPPAQAPGMPPPINPRAAGAEFGLPVPPAAPAGTPGPQTGLLPPPPIDQPSGQGLLAAAGGSTGSYDPFDLAAPGAAGGLLPDPGGIRIEQLSGEAAPAGAGRQARVKFWTDQGMPQHVAEGIADRVGAESKYNPKAIGDRGTSGGLYQHHADRLARLKTFAAQQNLPWTDPGVQDRFAATEVRGGDAIATRGFPAIAAAPDRQTAAKLWDQFFERSAAGPGSGGGRRVQVEPLGGEAVLPAGSAPALPGGGGKIPGTNMTPQQAAGLSMLLDLSGMKGNPLGPLLETYYKSPGYIAQSAAASELGKLPFEGPKAAAIAAAQQQYIQQNQAHQSDLDIAKELLTKGGLVQMPDGSYKQIKTITDALAAVDIAKQSDAASRDIVTVAITPPGASRPQEMQMTRAQAKDVVEGRGVPALGIPPMSGAKLGKPVFSPGEAALGPVEAKDIFDKHQVATDAAMTIETNKEARALLDAGVFAGAGADRVTALAKLGNALKLTGKTTQETVANTEAYLATTAGNVGRMIKQFGSGTGLSDADREYAAQMAAGKTTLDETSIRRILDINDRASMNIINRHNQRVSKIAPGATMTDLNVPVPKPYERQWKEGDTVTYPDGSKRVLTGGQWFEVQTPGGKR